MKAKYQKYYDALKGKDFSGPVSQYASSLSTATTSLNGAEASINSSSWIEKGLEIIKGSVLPSLKSQMSQLESGISALSQVAGKVTELVSSLDVLDGLEKELESLGGKWTYTEGGTKSESEVNSHNSRIDELNKKIEAQESAVDGIVAAINGISFNFSSSQATFGGFITNIKAAVKEAETTLTIDIKKRIFSTNPEINKKIQQIIGPVDDPNSYEATKSNYRSMRKDILVIDTETGQTYNRDDVINMKEGETKRLIVRLPVDTGMIKQITRTTADNNGSRITRTYSDVDPDPNKVQSVRRSSNTWPDDMSLLHNNCYEWIVTSTGGKGTKTLSQTVEYNTDVSRGENLKAMTRIKFNIQ